MDVYLAASSVPYLVLGLLVGAMSYSIVPLLVSWRVHAPDVYAASVGNLLIAIALMATGICVLAVWISPYLLNGLASTLSVEIKSEAIVIAKISWLTVFSAVIVSYLAAIQNSARRFVLPVLVNLLPFIGMIVIGSLWAEQIGTVTLAWGMLVGNGLAMLFLFIGARQEILLRISFRRAYLEILPILITLPLVLLSISGTQIMGVSDAFWALRLTPGSLSYLGYGQRIVIALGSLVIQGPSIVIAPYLSETAALGQFGQFRHTTAQAVRIIIFFAAPTAMIMTLLRIPLVEFLFQRGAFDAPATDGVSFVLPGMLVGMIAMVSVVILLRALHACRDIAGAAMIGGVGAICYFSLSGAFSGWFGLSGIVLAYAVTWWFLLGLAIWRIWRRESIQVFAPRNLRFIISLLISLLACAAPVWLLWHFWGQSVAEIGPFGLGLRLVTLGGLGGSAFLGVSAGLFRMPEIMIFVQKISTLLESRLRR